MRPIFAALAVAILCAWGGGSAQAAPALAIPGAPVATDLPGATQLPDPKRLYKVVFDLDKAAPKDGDGNPGLEGTARFVNTLAAHGVQPDHRKIAVVIHQGATDMILDNPTFRARHGRDNPDLPLIHAMTKAGVKFYVCGQAVLARKIEPKTIDPDVELTLWALTTLVNLELDGYVKVGG